MNILKVLITFKSGRTLIIESRDFKKGEFRGWVDRNFVKGNGEVYEFVVWNNILVNSREVESVQEIQ